MKTSILYSVLLSLFKITIPQKPMKKILTHLKFLGAAVFVLFCASIASAQNVQQLYATPATPAWRDNYTGASGCEFTVGVSNVVVSHLGYFCSNAVSLASVQATAGLLHNHYVALFAGTGTPPPIIAEVTVPAGAGADWYTNQFVWMPLDPPVLLLSNVTYYVAAMPTNGDGDLWGDSFTATFNGFFVGATTNIPAEAPTTVYGPGGQWPPAGFSFGFSSNTTYCIESMANLPVDQARCSVQFTNVNVAPGNTISVLGFASGQPPITYQWYYNGAPLGGQINPVLTIPNANAAANNGTYYLTATNSLGGEQSATVNILVSDEPVGTVLGLTNMTVFANYLANFSLVVTGTPPISLQWFSNNVVIPSATTNEAASTNFPDTYSFYPSYPANNGNVYTAIASNNISPTAYTATNTSTLTVLPNVTYPQQQLIGALPNSLFSGNAGGGTENAAGALITANQSVLVTHMGYPATGLIIENQTALAANHNLSIYLWNNGSPQILGWAQVTNGTPTNSEINGYFWAPLNAPVQLTSGVQYLISAQTYNDVDDWGADYGVTNLNPYFSSFIAAYYVNNITWPTPPTLGGYGAQMYSCINMASLTNFAAVYVSNSAPSAADNYLSYSTNVLIPGGNTLNMIGFGEGQPPLYYPRWYLNGTFLAGQTNMNLTIPSVGPANTGNYTLVLSNYQTSVTVTSEVTTVTLVTYPLVLSQMPVTYTNIFNAGGQVVTNLMFIYSNANPTFSVSAAAATSTSTNYQWYSNNVAVGYATNSSLTLTNAQPPSLNVYCIITNIYGSATSLVWSATVLPDPTNSAGGLALYPQSVMALNPIAYWRMNDANLDGQDNLNGDDGYICHDYISGNDGIYTNAYYLGSDSPAYNPVADPSSSSATFSGNNSDVNSILAPNMGTPNGVNAEFTVEAWVDALATMAGENTPTIVAKGGYFQEEFTIDCGNTSSNCFRFEVRSANGTAYNANSTVPVDTGADENIWYHLVGVCDEANGLVSLFINGQLAATTTIPSASGITNTSATPLTIGSRSSTDSLYNNNEPFAGAINDVAMFNYPVGSNQIAAQYAVGGSDVVPFLSPAPVTSVQLSANNTLALPVTAYGTEPLTNTWTDISTSTVLASGSTNGYILNASYTNVVTGSWNNQTLQLIVANAYGAVTDYVAILVYTNAPVFAENLPASVTAGQGEDYIYTASFYGGAPLGYLWYSNGIALPASAVTGILSPVDTGTYAAYTATTGTNTYQIVVTNYAGASTSVLSTLIVVPPPSYSVASAILGLNPASYWPMHEVEPAAQGDIETNYGTLGAIANGFYTDWMQPYNTSFGFQHDYPTTIGGDPNSVFFSVTASGGGAITNAMLLNTANPGQVLNAPFTVESWCFFTQNVSYGDIWSQDGYEGLNAGTYGGGGGSVCGIRLDWGGNGANELTVYGYDNSSGLNSIVVTPETLPTNTWLHVVVTCDVNTNFSVFTNGVLCGTTAAGVGKYSPDYWTPFAVGSGRGYTRSIPQTAVADVAIYTNVVLPTATILNHYNTGVSANPTPSYFNTVMAANPPVFLRMDSPAWTNNNAFPQYNSLPPVLSFGSAAPAGVYSPGTAPGIAPGPNTAGVPWSGYSGSASNVVPLSGVSSYGDAGYSPTLDPSAKYGTGSNAFSVAITFRGNPAEGTFQDIVGHSDNSWRMTLGANAAGGGAAGSVQFTYGSTVASGVNCNDGNWHQAVGVYSPATPNSAAYGSVELFVDGQLNATNQTVSSNGIAAGSTLDVFLGAAPDYTNNGVGVGRQFEGQVCDVAVFTNALTFQQVQALYVASGAPHSALSISQYLPTTGTNFGTTNLMTLYAGASPNFLVRAVGAPVYYQWYTNGVAVGFGTNGQLTLPNVQNAFTTYCIATNNINSVTSVVWSASVVADPDPAGSFSQTIMSDGPVAYWRLNEPKGSLIADDYAGGANGFYGSQTTNGAPGVPIVGATPEQGVWMDPTASTENNGTVTNNGIILDTNACTFICWVMGNNVEGNPSGLFENRSTANSSGFQLAGFAPINEVDYNWSGSSGAYNYGDPNGIITNQWGMAVLVISPQGAHFYVFGPTNYIGTAFNGFLSQAEPFYGLNYIGADPNGGVTRILNGKMNEMAIFNYDLSVAQINALYYAATNGAYTTAFFVTPPQNTTAAVGSTTGFSVGVSSFLEPMTYQWYYNTTPSYAGASALANGLQANGSFVQNATTGQLTITNVTFSAAGYYFVAVGNSAGTTNSAIALLTVTPSTTPVKLGTAVTNSQLYLSWPANHTGWQLQAQTNPVIVGIKTNWVNYNPSTATNLVVIPVNLTNGTVFYRLIYNP